MFSKSFEIFRLHGKRSSHRNVFTFSGKKRFERYPPYIADGDSSSYGMVARVLKEKYFDQYVVVKEDCIGHAQKRMGSNLCKYKTDKKKKKKS